MIMLNVYLTNYWSLLTDIFFFFHFFKNNRIMIVILGLVFRGLFRKNPEIKRLKKKEKKIKRIL